MFPTRGMLTYGFGFNYVEGYSNGSNTAVNKIERTATYYSLKTIKKEYVRQQNNKARNKMTIQEKSEDICQSKAYTFEDILNGVK